MIDQNLFNDLFALWLSGSATMMNDVEIKYVIKNTLIGDLDMTIEFPTLSPTKAIVRRYDQNKKLCLENEYQNGKLMRHRIFE